MADEMKKKLEDEELDLDALENVSGGLLVDRGLEAELGVPFYCVVDDKTGDVIDGSLNTKDRGNLICELKGQSNKIISIAEYEERFGRQFSVSSNPHGEKMPWLYKK